MIEFINNLIKKIIEFFSGSQTVIEVDPAKTLHDLVISNSPGIGPKMTAMASKWFFHSRIKNLDYMILVDFDYRETQPRFWLVNRKDGTSKVFKVSHGSNSDPNKDGYATDFSNVPESHKSSLGAMVTLSQYNSSKFKKSMRLDGLQEGLNDKVNSRAIVFHSSTYVNDVKGQLIGDSWGCFAVSESTADEIISLIDDGALLFAYHKSLDVIYKDPKSFPLTKAIALIKKWEGLFLETYLDPVGIPTIGYGTTAYPNGEKVKIGEKITEERANELLVLHIEDNVTKYFDELIKVPVTENQYNALVSFAYNVGVDYDLDDIAEGLGDSTLLKKLNAGDIQGAANEFDVWIKAKGEVLPGLVNRRKDEKALFLRVDA